MDGIEKLYRNYEILAAAGDKISEHEAEYVEILDAVKGNDKEKRLASQFITRFFNSFPDKALTAIEAQLDLCEDDDSSIRKQALKDLPLLCKEQKEHVSKIVDVLSQFLATGDSQEFIVVNKALLSVFKIDSQGTFSALFSQILNGEDNIREKCIKFLSNKIKTLTEESLGKELEEFVLEESKKVLLDVTGEEFITFMDILSHLKICKTLTGQQTLLEIVIDQAELDKEFEPSDPDFLDKLIQCIKQAIPFFSIYAPSTKFFKYITEQVLPVLSSIKRTQDDTSTDENIQVSADNSEFSPMELFRLLAEISVHCGELETEKSISQIFDKLLEYMPLPPPSDENADNNTTESEESKLEFSCVECLMYALHQLGKKQTDFLSPEKNPERMKDFRLRLQYFARRLQGYIKELREALHGKKTEELKSDENKLKMVALKTTTNINALIRDLFHNPPSYKSTMTLSWKSAAVANKPTAISPTDNGTSTAAAAGTKRSNRTPITFGDGNSAPAKKGRREGIYMPPGGKYSDKVSKYYGGERGRGGGGGAYRRGYKNDRVVMNLSRNRASASCQCHHVERFYDWCLLREIIF